jgi:hypothetical protein
VRLTPSLDGAPPGLVAALNQAEMAVLDVRDKALRDELIRRNVPAIQRTLYDPAITSTVRWTLDTKAVKPEMSAAW